METNEERMARYDRENAKERERYLRQAKVMDVAVYTMAGVVGVAVVALIVAVIKTISGAP